MAKNSITKKILETLLEGGELVDEIAEKVCVCFPTYDYGKMRSLIYKIMNRIKRKSEKRYQKYEIVEGLFQIVDTTSSREPRKIMRVNL